jgi:hypothetical protein
MEVSRFCGDALAADIGGSKSGRIREGTANVTGPS